MKIINTKTCSQALLLLMLISCGVKNNKLAAKPESENFEAKSIVLADLDSSIKDFRTTYQDLYLSREDLGVYQIYSWQSVLNDSDISNVSENINKAWDKNFMSIARPFNSLLSNLGTSLNRVCETKKMPRLYRDNGGYITPKYDHVIMGDDDVEKCKEILKNSDDAAFVMAYTHFVNSRFNLKIKISSYLKHSADQATWLYRQVNGPQDKGAPFLPFMKAIVKQLSKLEKDLVDTSLIKDRKITYDLQALLLLERSCDQLEIAAKEIESLAQNNDEQAMVKYLNTIISSFRIVADKYL